MKKITVKDIIVNCKGQLLCGDEQVICEDFCKDTRQLKENDIYVGIKGENFDGNSLYEEAFAKGAKVCILQGVSISSEKIGKYEKLGKVIIMVEDTIEAIGKIASYKRSLYDIPVIAVTGSVGKTSTKDIIASVVKMKYNVLKTQGNLNNHIGLPFTILGLKEHEALVTEMGMNHFGEIEYLTQIARPTIAVITNIGTSHIGNLGSRENILKAKLEILKGLSQEGVLILNNDNDLLHKWNLEDRQVRKITYGIEESAEFCPENITIEELESSYDIQRKGKEYLVKVPISGKHFVYNSLCAIAVGEELGIPMEEIIEGIQNFELTKNRMDVQKVEIKGIGNVTIINDAYNASYDSMKASLEYLKDIQGKRKIAVLGDMLELGEYSKDLHEKVGKEVVNNEVGILITVGILARDIASQAQKDGMKKENIYCFETNIEALKKIQEIREEGDVFLFKASNAMKFFEMAEEMKK